MTRADQSAKGQPVIPVHIVETLSDLRARRDYIQSAIDVLSQIWESQPPEAAAAKPPVRPVRTQQHRAAGVVPTGHDATSEKILTAMRKTLRPVSLPELRKETGLSGYLIGTRIKALAKQRVLVVTGATSGRRIALPEHAAKEGFDRPTSWHQQATKRPADPEMESVWHGGEGLTSVGRE